MNIAKVLIRNGIEFQRYVAVMLAHNLEPVNYEHPLEQDAEGNPIMTIPLSLVGEMELTCVGGYTPIDVGSPVEDEKAFREFTEM